MTSFRFLTAVNGSWSFPILKHGWEAKPKKTFSLSEMKVKDAAKWSWRGDDYTPRDIRRTYFHSQPNTTSYLIQIKWSHFTSGSVQHFIAQFCVRLYFPVFVFFYIFALLPLSRRIHFIVSIFQDVTFGCM